MRRSRINHWLRKFTISISFQSIKLSKMRIKFTTTPWIISGLKAENSRGKMQVILLNILRELQVSLLTYLRVTSRSLRANSRGLEVLNSWTIFQVSHNNIVLLKKLRSWGSNMDKLSSQFSRINFWTSSSQSFTMLKVMPFSQPSYLSKWCICKERAYGLNDSEVKTEG